MFPDARSASATLIASLSLLLVLASCVPGDDDPDCHLDYDHCLHYRHNPGHRQNL